MVKNIIISLFKFVSREIKKVSNLVNRFDSTKSREKQVQKNNAESFVVNMKILQ